MIVVVRGGGDLASGVALRLQRAGLRVVISELPQPLAVRRLVSFANAIYLGECRVEEVIARRVQDPSDSLRVLQVLAKGQIPVIVDPQGEAVGILHPMVVVDARMTKKRAELIREPVKLILGLGPGFVAGENCHAAIETNRGHNLGRVIWNGAAEEDTGLPEAVGELREARVLRAPTDGELLPLVEICDHLEAGQPVAQIADQVLKTPITGVLRGMLYPGVKVQKGLKIGDVDPRDDVSYCTRVSDKSLAVGGGVLEAILSRPELRQHLWT